MAVIGLIVAFADLGYLHLSGFSTWLIWLFVPISFVIGFDNKPLVSSSGPGIISLIKEGLD